MQCPNRKKDEYYNNEYYVACKCSYFVIFIFFKSQSTAICYKNSWWKLCACGALLGNIRIRVKAEGAVRFANTVAREEFRQSSLIQVVRSATEWLLVLVWWCVLKLRVVLTLVKLRLKLVFCVSCEILLNKDAERKSGVYIAIRTAYRSINSKINIVHDALICIGRSVCRCYLISHWHFIALSSECRTRN